MIIEMIIGFNIKIAKIPKKTSIAVAKIVLVGSPLSILIIKDFFYKNEKFIKLSHW